MSIWPGQCEGPCKEETLQFSVLYIGTSCRWLKKKRRRRKTRRDDCEDEKPACFAYRLPLCCRSDDLRVIFFSSTWWNMGCVSEIPTSDESQLFSGLLLFSQDRRRICSLEPRIESSSFCFIIAFSVGFAFRSFSSLECPMKRRELHFSFLFMSI